MTRDEYRPDDYGGGYEPDPPEPWQIDEWNEQDERDHLESIGYFDGAGG